MSKSTGKVVLYMNARDEKHLHEWVAHHLLIGFDEIYIYDHKSLIPLKGQFDNFNKNGMRVFVNRCERVSNNLKDFLISESAKHAASINAKWMLYLDADEFFVMNRCSNIKELLSNYKHADSVSFNWLIFGTNYHEKEPHGLIIDNYTKSELQLNEHLKTFIRPKEFLSPNAHRSDVKNLEKAIHGNNTILGTITPPYKCNRHYINNVNYDKSYAYIAHYYVQSTETYVNRKLKLPRDDWNTFRDNTTTVSGKPISYIHSEFNDVDNYHVKNKYSENIKNYLKTIGYYESVS